MESNGLLYEGSTQYDGRTVGFAVLGDPAGRPVLWHHPTPSSRLELANPTEGPALAAAGLRVVAPDRPGYGRTDPWPDRTVLDGGRDALAVLDALGLTRVDTVGFSGGGPPALALAALAPDRLGATAVVAGDGPVASLPDLSDAVAETAAWFGVRSEADGLAVIAEAMGVADARAVDAERFAEYLLSWAGPATRARLTDPATRDATLRRLREPGRQGVAGELSDLLSSKRDWGFRVEEIRTPVTLHYGTRDTNSPAAIGRWLAARIPGAELLLTDADHAELSDRLVAILAGTGAA